MAMRLLLIPVLLLPTIGCGGKDVRKHSAASAATIYEAALAIEQGVPPALPCGAIKANAMAIILAQGYTYTPSSASAGTPR